jgi:hypothetical protein
MKHLVCIVEGRGEVQAVPKLCARLLAHLGVKGWYVDENPIRRSRAELVDERVSSPYRPCRPEQLGRALLQARSRSPNAILVLCDADDDCAGTWGPNASAFLVQSTKVPGAAVMAEREYETWLLAGLVEESAWKSSRGRRDAKGALRHSIPGYKPTTHQLICTQQLDLARAWARSDSFDKLVRSLAKLCGVTCPPRPVSP